MFNAYHLYIVLYSALIVIGLVYKYRNDQSNPNALIRIL